MRRRLLTLALLVALTLSSFVALAPTQDASAHTYTTTYGYCWKFVSGVYYYRERTTVWMDNWWGSGHYAAYVSEVQYGRCLIA